jgi:hypothetical protein
MSAPPQLSLVWFAPGEVLEISFFKYNKLKICSVLSILICKLLQRTLATSIMVLFGNIGSGVAYLLGLIVTSDSKLMTLIYIEAVVSLITGISFLHGFSL